MGNVVIIAAHLLTFPVKKFYELRTWYYKGLWYYLQIGIQCNLETYINGVSCLAHLGVVVGFCIRSVSCGDIPHPLLMSEFSHGCGSVNRYSFWGWYRVFCTRYATIYGRFLLWSCLWPGKCVPCYKRSMAFILWTKQTIAYLKQTVAYPLQKLCICAKTLRIQ